MAVDLIVQPNHGTLSSVTLLRRRVHNGGVMQSDCFRFKFGC